jgi:hypothetical protein
MITALQSIHKTGIAATHTITYLEYLLMPQEDGAISFEQAYTLK